MTLKRAQGYLHGSWKEYLKEKASDGNSGRGGRLFLYWGDGPRVSHSVGTVPALKALKAGLGSELDKQSTGRSCSGYFLFCFALFPVLEVKPQALEEASGVFYHYIPSPKNWSAVTTHFSLGRESRGFTLTLLLEKPELGGLPGS